MARMDQATAAMRLILAEIMSREEQLDGVIRQFRAQLARLPRQVIYGGITLDLALSAMAEIQERLNHSQTTRAHLEDIKKRATEELRALELTQQVEEAKVTLRDLNSRAESGQELDEGIQSEVRRLKGFIAEYSRQAERYITSSSQERES